MYKLKNIPLEYERIRNKQLADQATTAYTNGKGFAYDQVVLEKTVTFDRGTDADLNLLVNPPRRSLKGILLLFIIPYNAGTRDVEAFFNPDITNAEVTINGIPNRVYNNGIKGYDQWREISRLFCEKHKKISCGNNYSLYTTLGNYLALNKFGFFLDLRSMAGVNMHSSGQRLVNSENGVNPRCLYQPGELEGGGKRATDPIWSLKVYNIEKVVTKPKEPVMYYLFDGPKRGFVREELMVVPSDTVLPPLKRM